MLGSGDYRLTTWAFGDPEEGAEYYHGTFTSSNRPFTCKVSPFSEASAQWIGENQAYLDLQCPALITAFGYSKCVEESGQFLLIFTEPIDTNFAADITARRTQNKRYELPEVISIIRQCMEGLKAILRAGKASIGHGNLTPSSIFKTMEGKIKLGNFNSALANHRHQGGSYSSYIHPTVSKGKTVQPWQADVFDLGVLQCHLCALNEPQGLQNLRTPAHYKGHIKKIDTKYQDETFAVLFSELMQINENKTASQAIEQIEKMCATIESGFTKAIQSQTMPQPEAAPQNADGYLAAGPSPTYEATGQAHFPPVEKLLSLPHQDYLMQDYPSQLVEGQRESSPMQAGWQGDSRDIAQNPPFASEEPYEFPQSAQPLQVYQQEGYASQWYGGNQVAAEGQPQPLQGQPMQLDSKACASCNAVCQLRAGACTFVCAECFALNRL